ARPLVLGPDTHLAVEVVPHGNVTGVMWCDGSRTTDLPPGARVEVRRSTIPVRLARLNTWSFTDRLVAKFALPVQGWRGRPEAGGAWARGRGAGAGGRGVGAGVAASGPGSRRRGRGRRRCTAPTVARRRLPTCSAESGSNGSVSSRTPSWSWR